MDFRNLLNKINSPEDLKALSPNELTALCDNIRCKIINTVSQNGGHLASNLGTVELTISLLRIFNPPTDQIIWDVGHQCYAYKILTGRKDMMHTIRKEGGLSGFPKCSESKYDAFNVGHSSTSISAALGLANAKLLTNTPGHVIAVIGDGALSGGLAYEGLNNAGRFNKNFIVILNDNKMSISKNVGSMSTYLTHIRMKSLYLKIKRGLDQALDKIALMGTPTKKVLIDTKEFLKNSLHKKTIFEDMGFAYYGPIDGHNIKALSETFENAKLVDKPLLIHIVTTKGKGYSFAEKDPKNFHGISRFNIGTGQSEHSCMTYSSVFGDKLCQIAKSNKKICAITAAMTSGTGLSDFSTKYPNRFFDVGIAEGHAVTFSAGLSAGGLTPVVAVYSSFLQRSYDQIIHDAAAQNINLVLAIDRAGIVGEDGETHQGVFDASFLNAIPNVTIFAPTYFDELKFMLQSAIDDYDGVRAIRYPRGYEPYRPEHFISSEKPFNVLNNNPSSNTLLVTYGRLFAEACIAQKELAKENVHITILKLNTIKPIPLDSVRKALSFKKIFFFEEGIKSGGIGESFLCELATLGFTGSYTLQAINNTFVYQASIESSLATLMLDSNGMKAIIKKRLFE